MDENVKATRSREINEAFNNAINNIQPLFSMQIVFRQPDWGEQVRTFS